MANRYRVLTQVIDLIKPQTIVEIGVHRGDRMVQMIRAARQHRPEVIYRGLDLWEWLDDSVRVGHGKGANSRSQCEQRMAGLMAELNPELADWQLVQGDTELTLAAGMEADLVFVDGDHRTASIERDCGRVSQSQVIVLDDWYCPSHPVMGSNGIDYHKRYAVRTRSLDGCNLGGVDAVECVIATDLEWVVTSLENQGCVRL